MNILKKKIRRVLEIGRKRGWRGVRRSLNSNYRKLRAARDYQKWIREFDILTDEDRAQIRHRIENFSHKPLISIVLPVYNVEEKWLRFCVESVRQQLYTNWELCIADDCSPALHIKKVLAEYAEKDERIKIVYREKNGHISAASNSALELATGEFVVLLDHDDELAEHALYYVAEELNGFPETAMIYSDEDLIDERGRRYEPKFKPDWSQDFIYSLNLITHLSAYRTEILRRIGGFQIGREGSQDYDLALRVVEQIAPEQIRHIPHILYHWRAIQGSVALSGDEKPYAQERAREAIRAHFSRTGKTATVTQTLSNLNRVQYEISEILPKISLINRSSDARLFENLIVKTNYENLETRRVDSANETSIAENLNRAARESSGEILVFLDGDFAPLDSGWLGELAGFAQQEEIGAVGAKIIDADENIRNAGIILGVNGAAGFAHRGLPNEDDGNFLRLRLINNFSAVASVLVLRRELFEANGGFDAENFSRGLFDVDFCLRLGAKGYRILLDPYAELTQLSESSTENILRRENAPETANFKTRWAKLIAADPFYNPNLSLENERFEIAIPPRFKKIQRD